MQQSLSSSGLYSVLLKSLPSSTHKFRGRVCLALKLAFRQALADDFPQDGTSSKSHQKPKKVENEKTKKKDKTLKSPKIRLNIIVAVVFILPDNSQWASMTLPAMAGSFVGVSSEDDDHSASTAKSRRQLWIPAWSLRR